MLGDPNGSFFEGTFTELCFQDVDITVVQLPLGVEDLSFSFRVTLLVFRQMRPGVVAELVVLVSRRIKGLEALKGLKDSGFPGFVLTDETSRRGD